VGLFSLDFNCPTGWLRWSLC